jgi:hypothetical protein
MVLHEFLSLEPGIILTILSCNVDIILVQNELPPKIIPYFIMEWK